MRRLSIPFILPWLVFIVPVNIYIIGDWAAAGIQWALFRYQISSMGSSLICLGNDVNHIYLGLLSPRTLCSVMVWFLAVAILFIGIILLLNGMWKQKPDPFRNTGKAILIAGILFLGADMIQYGPVLFSKYSTCIPLGIPVLLVIGYWEFRYAAGFSAYQEISEPVNLKVPEIRSFLDTIRNSEIIQEIAILIVISLFFKFFVYSLSYYSPYEVNGDDIRLYYSYATMVLSGHIPYYQFPVEYPQFFFIPVLLAAIPLLAVPDLSVYSTSILILMYLFDIGTLVLVVLSAEKFFGKERAFLCGLLYATAFSAVFFLPLTYDSFPTFLLMLALYLFVNRNESAAYLSATAGMLAKWFPGFCYPFFLLFTLKNKTSLRPALKGMLVSAGFIIISILPFLYLSPGIFLQTYAFQIGRKIDPHSLIYYLDALTGMIFHFQPWAGLSFVLLIIGECLIIGWYWRWFDAREVSLFAALFLSIFYFILENKAGTPTFIVWITPFLALFLANTYREIIVFYLAQLIIYIEAPLFLGIIWGKTANGEAIGYMAVENSLPTIPFLYYSIKYAFFLLLIAYLIVRFSREYTSKHDGDNEHEVQ